MIKDVRFGDFNKGGSEFLIRLFPRFEQDEVMGVGFCVYQVVWIDCENPERSERAYTRMGAVDPLDVVTDPAEAEIVARGFVKWDGCTQFDVEDVHVDSAALLRAFFDAILEARKLCAEMMFDDATIREEY